MQNQLPVAVICSLASIVFRNFMLSIILVSAIMLWYLFRQQQNVHYSVLQQCAAGHGGAVQAGGAPPAGGFLQHEKNEALQVCGLLSGIN